MPNISQFEAPALDIRPTSMGSDAMAAAARRGGSFFREAADAYGQLGQKIASTVKDVGQVAVDYMQHKEVNQGAATFAGLTDNLTKKWNETVKGADPNDPSVAAKFREEVLAPELDKWSSAFQTQGGQQWAERHVEQLRNHMFEKTSADMATLAGIAVRKNVSDATTRAANTAYNDPSSVPFLIDSVGHSVGGIVGSSPNLKGVDGARISAEVTEKAKATIVQNGFLGALSKTADPEAEAKRWAAKYPDIIDAADADKAARTQLRANRADAAFERTRATQEAKDRSDEATQKYITDIRSQDPRLKNDPVAQRVLVDPNLSKTDKNRLLDYIDRQNKPETATRLSQETFVGLLREMRKPDANPDEVMQRAWDARLKDPGAPGSMSEHDFNQFRAEVVARKTPEGAALERDRGLFFKQYTAMILGQKDAASYNPQVGNPKLYLAEMDARRVENDLRRKNLDPHLAYDPSSEWFLGKPERLQKWQQSLQVDLQTQAAGGGNGRGGSPPTAAAAAEPRRPDVPPALRGIAALAYSKSRNMWRDETTGELYDATGKPVKKPETP